MKPTILLALMLAFTSAHAEDAKIVADKSSGCAPLTVSFSANEQETKATYAWDFGNGHTSDKKAPAVVFMKGGVYQVSLIVNSKNGVQSVTTTVTVHDAPKADFSMEKTRACVNEAINFSAAANPSIAKYVWGFGDGKTWTGTNASHAYTTDGNYNVTLVVTDQNGCTADKTSYSSVTVFPLPVAAFKPSVESSCSETQEVSFTNESQGNGLSYSWAFGDGKSSNEKAPVHLFGQGKHNVTLSVKDINECSSEATKNVSITKLNVDFQASNENPGAGESIKFYSTSNFKGTSWSWEFGDGTVSAVHSPDKIYNQAGTYTVKFTLTDGVCSETKVKKAYIDVIKATPVTFSSNVTSSCTSPTMVKFTNTTPNTAMALWEFGDGTVSTNPNPEKVFNTPGNYKVTLSITDSSGFTTKKGIDNYIQTAKPMVRFGGDTFGCPGYPVKFSNFTPNATSYLWSFGDGETSTLKNPKHSYKQKGYYTVSLTARNGEGCDSTIVMNNYVHIDTIKADFEMVTSKAAVPPFLCSFNNTTNIENAKYIWDFGDGTSETSANPVHMYNTPGNFKVRLVAFTKSGCSSVKVVENAFQMGTTLNHHVVHEGM